MVSIDRDKAIFISLDPIDKIVQSGEMTINHPGAVGTSNAFESNLPTTRLVEATEPNTYGRACFVRAVWSDNNGDTWQPAEIMSEGVRSYTFTIDGGLATTDYFRYCNMQVVVGSDDSVVRAKVFSGAVTNGFSANFNTGTNVTTYSGWTAIPSTIRVRYWLYERE